MQNNYNTARLILNELSLSDAEFISELVNTPEWIQFIGDRNVRSMEDAIAYIQKILDNPNVHYWVVRTRDREILVGIITFIRRDYLDHPDIGFAFLPRHTKQGYAYEAASAVLNDIKKDSSHSEILATTVKENKNSIRLLEKLSFRLLKKLK
jgi:RimJ/RimL family protein N-acetyltransferase